MCGCQICDRGIQCTDARSVTEVYNVRMSYLGQRYTMYGCQICDRGIQYMEAIESGREVCNVYIDANRCIQCMNARYATEVYNVWISYLSQR